MSPPNPGHSTLLLITLFALLSSPLVQSALVNVTVDDAGNDPITGASIIYAPVGHWATGNTCPGCLAQPDPSRMYDGSWHDTTFDNTIVNRSVVTTVTFQFTGSAIYVYGAQSLSLMSPNSTADYSFFIDGEAMGNLMFNPPGLQNSYNYNVLLYANDSIPTGDHTFELQNGRPGGITSLLLLDYIVYTREMDSTTSPPPPPSLNAVSTSSAVPTSSAVHTTSTVHTTSPSSSTATGSTSTGTQLRNGSSTTINSSSSANNTAHTSVNNTGSTSVNSAPSSPSMSRAPDTSSHETASTSAASSAHASATADGAAPPHVRNMVIAAVVVPAVVVMGLTSLLYFCWLRVVRRGRRGVARVRAAMHEQDAGAAEPEPADGYRDDERFLTIPATKREARASIVSASGQGSSVLPGNTTLMSDETRARTASGERSMHSSDASQASDDLLPAYEPHYLPRYI